MDLDDAPRAPRAGRRARAEASTVDVDQGFASGAFGASGSLAAGDLRPAAPSGGFGAPGDGSMGGGGGAPATPMSPSGGGAEAGGGVSEDGSQQAVGTSRPPPPRRGGFEGGFDGPTDARPLPADPLADGSGKKFEGVSRRKQAQQSEQEEEKVRARSKYDDRAQVAEIMDIPELEEEGKEDLTRVVAEAPKVRSNKVQGINELDEDMQFRLPSTDDRDVDLSMLTTVLCSSEQVHEPDEVWDPDMLFTQVASELNSEKEKAEGVPEPGADGGGVLDIMPGPPGQ